MPSEIVLLVGDRCAEPILGEESGLFAGVRNEACFVWSCHVGLVVGGVVVMGTLNSVWGVMSGPPYSHELAR